MVSPVYTYVPNIIGYSRILFTTIAFYYAYDDYIKFFILYSISELLDMADGHAARYLGQCSKFGAVLDMITDRCSTMMLCIVLTDFYPERKYIYCFLAICSLDLVSHYARLYSSLATGSSGHKEVKANHFALMKIYYSNKYFLALMVAGNEGFWLALYLLHFNATSIAYVILVISAPICFLKQLINVIQFIQAMKDIVVLDENEARIPKRK